MITTVLLSCQRKIKFTPPPDEIKKDTSVISGPVPFPEGQKAVKSFKGLYISGNEASTFYDCSTQQVYWLTDSTNRIAELYRTSNRALPYPYESVYVELSGYLNGKSTTGYASEYQNELIVTNVIRLLPKDYRTECYPYEFVALGNEPSWLLEILPQEKKIVFKDVSVQKVYEFPYQAAADEQGRIHYLVTSVDKKNRIDIVLEPQVCSDGMSEVKYQYSAAITLNGTRFKGCAVRKGELPR